MNFINENSYLTPYIEFLHLLQEKYIQFSDFDKYTYDELFDIKQLCEINMYIEYKNNKLEK